jgi:hypothetical protein
MNDVQTHSATHKAQDHQPGEGLRPAGDLVEYFREYARERPEVMALWCLGIGFVLGWKLKIW